MQVPTTFARVNTLGQPKRVHKLSAGQRLQYVVIIVVMLVLTAVAYVALGQSSAALADIGLGLYGQLAPLLFVVIALFALVRALTNWNKAIVLYERGLAFKDRRGLHAWRWEEIQTLYSSVVRKLYMGIIPVGTSRSYTVVNDRNEMLHFDQGLARARDAAELIRRAAQPHMLARSIQAYHAGQVVNFGVLAVSRQGLHQGQRIHPWSQVREVKVHDGRLRILPQGVRVATAGVANLDVFLALLEQVGGVALVQ